MNGWLLLFIHSYRDAGENFSSNSDNSYHDRDVERESRFSSKSDDYSDDFPPSPSKSEYVEPSKPAQSVSVRKPNIVLENNTGKPKVKLENLKKIDLGAAAHYAQQHATQSNKTQLKEGGNFNDLLGLDAFPNSNNTTAQSNSSDLLSDLFSDMTVNTGTANSNVPNSNPVAVDDFADFSHMNSSNNNDEFEDFQSAAPFTQSSQYVPTVPSPSSTTADLMSNIDFTNGFPAAQPSVPFNNSILQPITSLTNQTSASNKQATPKPAPTTQQPKIGLCFLIRKTWFSFSQFCS